MNYTSTPTPAYASHILSEQQTSSAMSFTEMLRKSFCVKKFYVVKCFLLVMVLGMLGGKGWGQTTVPATFDMTSGSSYTLSSYPATSTGFPPNMSIGLYANSTPGNFITSVTSDASNSSSNTGWYGEGTNGISILGSSSLRRGSFLFRANTTGRISITIAWTARTILDQANKNYIELQWSTDAGTSWNNVTGDGPYVGGASASSYSVILPNATENVTDLRIRWIYYEDATGGARDRLAIDDITVSSSASSVCSGTPTAGVASATTTSGTCSVSSTTLSLSGQSTGSGINYQWQSSTDNTNFFDIPGATSATYNVTTAVITTTYYLCVVACNNGGLSAKSTTATVTVNAPAGGTTAASTNPVCSGSNTTLSLNGATSSGVSYQWQSSSNGNDYTNIAGATSSTFTAAPVANIYYRCLLTCMAGGGQTSTSTPLQVTINTTANNVTNAFSTNGNAQSAVNWTTPTGCFNEVIVVAATATNTGTPSGTGTNYNANASYGNGSAFGNGYVVYKGTLTSVTVTGLTNGTTYYFKIFTRNGSNWSGGIEVNATPALPTASTDYFRSRASGIWAIAGTWESSPDGSKWITATASPTSAANTISILNGHTVTVAGAVSADQIIVNTGGAITVNSNITFTIGDGAGNDLVVDGTITNRGTVGISSGAAVIFNSAGTYVHAVNGGIIPTASWNGTSTCNVTGMTSIAPSGLGQSFGNFTWNCPSQSDFFYVNNNNFGVAGLLRIISTNSTTFTMGSTTSGTYTNTLNSVSVEGGTFAIAFTSGVTANTTITNDLNISGGGQVIINGSAGIGNLSVQRDLSISGTGYMVLLNASTSPNATINITRDLLLSGNARIDLEKVNTASSAGVINVGRNFTSSSTGDVTNGVVLDFGGSSSTGVVAGNGVNIAGNFSNSGSGVFYTFSGNASNGFVFNGASGTQTFSYSGTNSDYVQYVVNSGSTLQMLTGLAFGISTSNPQSKLTVNGTIELGTNVISGGSTSTAFILGATGTLKTANTGGVVTSIANAGTKTFTSGAKYEFNSTTANQSTGFNTLTIATPSSITISNVFGTVTADANVVFGNSASLIVNTGSIFDVNTRTFTFGTTGVVTINGKIKTANTTSTGAFSGSSNSTIVSTNSPTVSLNTGSTVELSGASAQFAEARTFYNLIVNNASGVTLLGSETVNGTLGFTSGKITTGSNKVIISSTGSVSGGGTGWVIGNLQKNVATGTSISRTFEIGGSDNYRPVSVAFGNVSTAGDLTAAVSQTAGNHPQIATSGLDPNKTVLRYWTLANNGIVFNNYSATFTFAPQDVSSGANTNNFVVRKYNGSTWSGSTVGTRTITTTQATGFTSFSDFAIGEAVDANADYVSNGTVSTSTANGWTYNNGSAFVPAVVPPTSTNNITVRDIDNLTVAEDFTVGGGKTLTLEASVSNPFGMIVAAGKGLTIAGTANFNGRPVTFQSTAAGTARFGELTGTLTGENNVIVERYITATGNRAYRQLAPGVSGAGTIRKNWQEGVNNTTTTTNVPGNAGPGYGTHITGSQSGNNGFDATQTGDPSMYTLNSGATAWVPVSSTDNVDLNPLTGYLIYIRGDRSVDLNSNTSNSNTTLRSIGTLLTNDQTYTVTSGKYNLITNPFASSIDWAKIYNSNPAANLAGNFVYYDPNRNLRGAYITVQNNGTNNGPNPAATATNIQTGQAFWVKPNSGNSVVIHEADKSAVNNLDVFRTNGGTVERLQMLLYFKMPDGSRRDADGIAIKFGNDFSTAVGNEDAVKLANFDEDIAILRDNQKLSIEGRPLIDDVDTLPIFMAKMKMQRYEWQFDPTDFDAPGLQAFLQDKFLSAETPVSLTDQTIIPFSVTSDVASSASDRFRVVFRTSGVLPINFTNVKAYEKGSNIQVEWNLGNESNISKYEVEKSVNGRTFTKAGTQAVRAIANTRESYNWLDVTPNTGNNYYRIKAIEQSGLYKYSQVVNVKTGKSGSSISIYPNPVQGNVLSLQLVNQPTGKYAIQLYNNLGQEVYRSEFSHAGGSSTQTVKLNSKVVKGIYQLQVTNGEDKITQKVIVE